MEMENSKKHMLIKILDTARQCIAMPVRILSLEMEDKFEMLKVSMEASVFDQKALKAEINNLNKKISDMEAKILQMNVKQKRKLSIEEDAEMAKRIRPLGYPWSNEPNTPPEHSPVCSPILYPRPYPDDSPPRFQCNAHLFKYLNVSNECTDSNDPASSAVAAHVISSEPEMTTEVVSENEQHLNVSNECTGSNDPASSAVAAPTTSDVISSEPEMTTEVVSENEQLSNT
ncbi:uncharacterized protein [Musca autumnalis]|uniref:uncharacterized protein n=1 Tax=Musca autumnalis TaxID=221902 RepID=UPI003CF01716